MVLKRNGDILWLYLALLFYCALRTIIGGDPNILRLLFVQVLAFPCLATVFIYLMDKLSIPLRDMVIWLIWISVLISMTCLFLPPVNNFVKYTLTIQPEVLEEMFFRGFGLSGSLTSGYGTVLAVAYAYCLKERYFVFFYRWILVFFVAVSVIINARTAIFMLIVASALYLLVYFKLNYKILVAVILLFFIPFEKLFYYMPEETGIFIEEFYLEIKDLILGTEDARFNTSETIFTRMIVLPQGLFEWIIGRGYSVFGREENSTDIGFLRQLNYGGLIFLFFVLATFCRLMKKCGNKYFLYTSIAICLIANTKGNFLIGQDGYRLMTLIIMYEYYQQRKANSTKSENKKIVYSALL